MDVTGQANESFGSINYYISVWIRGKKTWFNSIMSLKYNDWFKQNIIWFVLMFYYTNSNYAHVYFGWKNYSYHTFKCIEYFFLRNDFLKLRF